MNHVLEQPSLCTGCTACYAICPHKSITMRSDTRGFLHPDINKEACTECNLCRKICPIENKETIVATEPLFYAVRHKDDEIRKDSSSGGVFTALCKNTIDAGGVVFGVRFDANLKVVHAKAESMEECALFRGSKYVQSTKSEIFSEVKKNLKSGRTVLFSGTPCECHGLKLYLNKEYDNLILCDFVCHGVPSPQVWTDYIRYKQLENKISSFKFRSKLDKISWREYYITVKYENHTPQFLKYKQDIYGSIWTKCIRSSCFSCSYASTHRISDITIADFHTIHKTDIADFEDDLGVSQVLVNTEKGARLLNAISGDVLIKKPTKGNLLQPNLIKPTSFSKSNETFWFDYKKHSFKFIVWKYFYIRRLYLNCKEFILSFKKMGK